MINLTIGKKDYSLAESYDELNLGKFIELTKILENKDKEESDLRFSLKLIAALIGCEVDILYQLSISDMNLLINEVGWVSENPKQKNTKKITIEGNHYGFLNLNGITTGEMISIESFQKNVNDNKENLHFVMAILFRKIEGGSVLPLEDDFEKIKERAELFKEKMMIGEVYGPLINFTTGGTGSTMKSSGPSLVLKIQRKNQSSSKK